MKLLLWTLIALLTLPLCAQSGVDSPMPVTLDILRDRYRPVLIFSDKNSGLVRRQIRLLAAQMYELHQRDVIVVPLILRNDGKPWGVAFGPEDIGTMDPLESARARQQFHITHNSFTVILLGKDGEEKLRDHVPIAYQRLRDLIDSMPMRQQEIMERNRRR